MKLNQHPRHSEKQKWLWYWEVRFQPRHFRQKKSKLWRKIDSQFNFETFINNKDPNNEIWQK